MNTKIMIRLFLLTLVAAGLMACGGKKEAEEAAPVPTFTPTAVVAEAGESTDASEAPAAVQAEAATRVMDAFILSTL